MNKLFALIMMVCVGSMGFSFAQVDDTMCNDGGSQIDAGIIFVDFTETKFVKCYEGRMVQPIGGDIIYTTTNPVNYDSGLPTNMNGLTSLGTSAEYGDVYRMDNPLAVVPGEELVFGTASVKDNSTMLYISRALIALLVIGGLFSLARKEQE